MAIKLEKLSDDVWVLMDGATILAEVKDASIVLRGTVKYGTDLISPSATELAALDGLTKTSTELNLMVAGVAGGYKVARSASPVALDGSNPTTVASGLASIVACGACLSGTAAPGVSTSVLSTAISTTNINVYAWKPTSAIDGTLIASDGTESFHWWAIGT